MGRLTGLELTPDVLAHLPDGLLTALANALKQATEGEYDKEAKGKIRMGEAERFAERMEETRIRRFAEQRRADLRKTGTTAADLITAFKVARRTHPEMTAAEFLSR
jgi:hypothetical protein